MTLSQIIAQALRQLGEDPQDVSEYEETFKIYANVGYDIAVREYLKPRREMCLDIDGNGRAPVVGAHRKQGHPNDGRGRAGRRL